MNKFAKVQLGYIAGLIDGEGSIGIVCTTPKRGYNSKRPMYQLRLIVTNTDYRMIKWLKDTIGYGHISETKRPNNKPNWAIAYKYSIVSHKAKELLGLVFPYLVIKREQANIAFDFCKTLLKQKDNKYGCTGLTTEILNERSQLKNRINFLNRRGKFSQDAKVANSENSLLKGETTPNQAESLISLACVETMGNPRKG